MAPILFIINSRFMMILPFTTFLSEDEHYHHHQAHHLILAAALQQRVLKQLRAKQQLEFDKRTGYTWSVMHPNNYNYYFSPHEERNPSMLTPFYHLGQKSYILLTWFF